MPSRLLLLGLLNIALFTIPAAILAWLGAPRLGAPRTAPPSRRDIATDTEIR